MEESQIASTCPACEAGGNFRAFTAREMMFGWRDSFAYCECPYCASLHIAQVPEDLARFYPSNYYSLVPPAASSPRLPWLQRVTARWLIGSRGGLAGNIARKVARKHPI